MRLQNVAGGHEQSAQKAASLWSGLSRAAAARTRQCAGQSLACRKARTRVQLARDCSNHEQHLMMLRWLRQRD